MNNTIDIHYLQLLSQRYPSSQSAGAEIINLQAILNLPKGTEHFVSDIHGEYEPFSHVLRNASGVIREMIDRTFGEAIPKSTKKSLAALIYYPEKKLELVKSEAVDMPMWYSQMLHLIILMCRTASSKYTRSKVRKALPKDYAYIIEELLHEDEDSKDKHRYYSNIIKTIIRLDRADDFICQMAHLIQRLAIDRLHVIGDIFDRGRNAAKVMELLCSYHDVDIQWGNHDISWMGAAAGCEALICNVIRIQARYGNLATLEEAYGINLVPLATFAIEAYKDDPCTEFIPLDGEYRDDNERALIAKMHKAITVMQFKCEGNIILRNPDYKMDDRILLDKINGGYLTIGGTEYKLKDSFLPTVDSRAPLSLTEQELDVLSKLKISFTTNEKLKKHVRFLFSHGSIYKIVNSNLLYHGGIPMNADGTFKKVRFMDKTLCGKEYLDEIDRTIRDGYFSKAPNKLKCLDAMWYIWCGPDSPLFGKRKMATFESYFIDDAELSNEKRSEYYELRNSPEVANYILRSFGLEPASSHIINGHVPVKINENPVKAGGRLFVIDGGFAKSYQAVTGIAGYTLIYNSHGLVLVSHEPFESVEKAVREEKDIHSSRVEAQPAEKRILVDGTDTGVEIRRSINDLENLLYAYSSGLIKEHGEN